MKNILLVIILLLNFSLKSQFAKPSLVTKKIVFDGNSLFQYGDDKLGMTRTPLTAYGLLPTPKRVYYNFSIGGRQTSTLTSEFDTKIAPYVNAGDMVILWEITNSAHYRIGDNLGDTLYNEVVAYCNKAKSYGLSVYVVTGIPRYMTGFDDINITSRINACNAKIRTNWATFCDGIIDIASTPTFSSTTSYTNTLIYEPDQTHLKNRGCDSVGYFIYRTIPKN